MIKSSGPKYEPWKIPHLMSTISDTRQSTGMEPSFLRRTEPSLLGVLLVLGGSALKVLHPSRYSKCTDFASNVLYCYDELLHCIEIFVDVGYFTSEQD